VEQWSYALFPPVQPSGIHGCVKRSTGTVFEAMKKSLTLLNVGLIVLQTSSCADFAAWVRQYTYPPTFHYISDEQLRSTMWRLAYHSRELRELMASPETVAVHRAEVLQHLRVMEEATVDLNRTGWPTNHPLVDANRSSFLQDIRTAQEAVSRDPPNFLLAGTVSGACVYCHRSR
jgi:hypothetical protein